MASTFYNDGVEEGFLSTFPKDDEAKPTTESKIWECPYCGYAHNERKRFCGNRSCVSYEKFADSVAKAIMRKADIDPDEHKGIKEQLVEQAMKMVMDLAVKGNLEPLFAISRDDVHAILEPEHSLQIDLPNMPGVGILGKNEAQSKMAKHTALREMYNYDSAVEYYSRPVLSEPQELQSIAPQNEGRVKKGIPKTKKVATVKKEDISAIGWGAPRKKSV